MGGCCQLIKSKEIPEYNEVDIDSVLKNTNNINYYIYQNKVEKIQSCYRGMKFRKKFYNLQSEITNTSNIKFNKITEQEFEEVMKKYPKLNSDNKNIKIVKNKSFENNKDIYSGEYNIEKNIKEGRGILLSINGTKYYGYFKNDKKNIKGKLIHYEGDIYEGEWLDDRANGKGKYIHIDGTTYDGEWKNDKQNGYGIETWNDGSYYKGFYLNGKKDGKGIYKWSDGSSYEGDFKDNTINGKGKYIWENKRNYEGDWINNKMWGSGLFNWPDGRIYEGMWKNGLQNGEGELFAPNLNQKRKGIWRHGKVIKWFE